MTPSQTERPKGHGFVWTKAHSISQLRVQVLTLGLSLFCLPAHRVLGDQANTCVSEEEKRGKEGDKNTNDCDLLLIVYPESGVEWSGGWGWGLERNPLQIELSLFEPGPFQKYKYYHRGHKWQRHNNLWRPVLSSDKTSLRGRSILTIHFWNYLHIDPGTSASKAGAHRL